MFLTAAMAALAVCCVSSSNTDVVAPVEDGITAPVGGARYWLGDTMIVAWHSTDLDCSDDVRISLFNHDTTIVVAEHVAAVERQAVGSHALFLYDSLIWDWDTPTFEYRIAVDGPAGSGVRYVLDEPVRLSYGMITPDASRSYHVGDTVRVQWVWNWYLCYDNQILLRFSSDAGETYHVIVPHGIENDDAYRGEFLWAIPSSIDGSSTVSAECIVQASPYSGYAENFSFTSEQFVILPAAAAPNIASQAKSGA
jgi:hypothetical protein